MGTPIFSLFTYDIYMSLYYFGYLFIYLFLLFVAAPVAYGSSQARGQIGALAAGLQYSHSNVGSKPHLRPTLKLTVTPDP